MRLFHYFFAVIIISVFLSCGDGSFQFPKTTFDAPFPKRDQNLVFLLADHLTIKSGNDTLRFNLFSGDRNVITNSDNDDTLFSGRVSRFRGLLYFSEQLNDSSYRIYAVKRKGNLIYGLNSGFIQTLLVDKRIESGQHQKMVKFILPDAIRLHPEKRELRTLFSEILYSIPPDTIIDLTESFVDHADPFTAKPVDPEEFEYLSKVYPNPVSDIVTIELQEKRNVDYELSDLSGKAVLKGRFSDLSNKINMSGQKAGLYYLTLTDPEKNQKETAKIVKGN